MDNQNLKKAGLKVTLPRMKILGLLESSEQRHMTAEDIYRHLMESGEEIGLATVYRVLTQFEGAGLVVRNHFEGGQAVFELSSEHHHDHLVCTNCGKVVEFLNSTIEECQDKVAAEHGFEISDHSLIIYGICPECHK